MVRRKFSLQVIGPRKNVNKKAAEKQKTTLQGDLVSAISVG
jgi:hypothetical protein